MVTKKLRVKSISARDGSKGVNLSLSSELKPPKKGKDGCVPMACTADDSPDYLDIKIPLDDAGDFKVGQIVKMTLEPTDEEPPAPRNRKEARFQSREGFRKLLRKDKSAEAEEGEPE